MIAPKNGTYKVLGANGGPCNGGLGKWPLPNGKPGAWLSVKGEIVPCRNGLHLCRAKHLLDWLGPTIWMAEIHPSCTLYEESDKLVVRRARLISQLETWNGQTQRLFAADCAERALKKARVNDKRCWAAVYAARRYALGLIGAATRAATWDATWDAARAATWGAARDATWAAALAAARDAAWAAARAATWATAHTTRDAAWAAERKWQIRRLFEYLNDKVDLDAIRDNLSTD